jgi:hypothetical protein
MRLLTAAIALSLATVAQPRGAVQSLTATADAAVGTFQFTVRGNNPCGAVELNYGDGAAVTHAIRDLPVTISYEYKRTGDFTVRARGQGNCDGTATASVRVTAVRPQPPTPPVTPPATTPPAGQGQRQGQAGQGQTGQSQGGQGQGGQGQAGQAGQGRGGVQPPNMRFAEMDLNRDGIISRAEWTGSSQSFEMHDWNGDGRLSGEEVRIGAAEPQDSRGRRGGSGGFGDWTDQGFRRLDLNRDNRISRIEWRYDMEDFIRLDRNRDSMLSLNEFLLGNVDDDRGDRFDDLDLNRDNRIDRREWHGSLDTFRWLDQNGDGYLSRFEAAGADTGRGGNRNPGTPGIPYPPSNARTITVDVSARQNWTDTGITVRAGDPLFIRANGRIQFSSNPRDIAEPDGARGRAATQQAPMPDVVIGALIGRIGNSRPFVVGIDSQGLRAPADGRLYLGVNDDVLRDNNGAFRVVLTVAGRRP